MKVGPWYPKKSMTWIDKKRSEPGLCIVKLRSFVRYHQFHLGEMPST